MALPQNTATILQFMFPGVEAKLFGVSENPSKVINGVEFRPRVTSIIGWAHSAPQPSEAEIVTAGNSAEFSVWLDNQTDPTKRRKISAKALLTSNEPNIVLLRGILKVLFQSLAQVRTAAGLPNRTFNQAMQDVASAIDAGQGEV